jgi:signal transduction histidine kinase
MSVKHPMPRLDDDTSYAAECRRLREERDAARQALATATQERDLLLANLSHELRTPLNAILGYAELLQLPETASSLNRQRYVETIKEASSYLVAIVDSVLDLSKMHAGALTLAETETAPAALIHSVLRVMQPLADRAHVLLEVRLPTLLPMIYADAQVLRQILINLVSNAIKASPAKASVSIGATLMKNGSLQFDVRDCGAGMNPATIERVMQPFAQADSAHGFGSHSTGLGLSLVRSMAELHEGRFQLVSHVGRGTRAIVTLPAARVLKPARPGQQVEFAFTRAPAPFGR